MSKHLQPVHTGVQEVSSDDLLNNPMRPLRLPVTLRVESSGKRKPRAHNRHKCSPEGRSPARVAIRDDLPWYPEVPDHAIEEKPRYLPRRQSIVTHPARGKADELGQPIHTGVNAVGPPHGGQPRNEVHAPRLKPLRRHL